LFCSSVSLSFSSPYEAALKCRQRKKAWLAQLQASNEYLKNENERLTSALVASREEISRLSALVGGAGISIGTGGIGVAGAAGAGATGQPVSMNVAVGGSLGSKGANGNSDGSSGGGRGYGY
jgi:ATF/CREB family transcription factor